MASTETLKQTPLHDVHRALGARMTPFAGFEMPLQYSGILNEHLAVRQAAGLFDVSHMGEFFVRGPRAFDFVQHLVTNDAARLTDGRAMYTVMCRPDGGIVDDLLVYRLGPEEYMLVVNAANIEKDFAWMQEHNPMGATLADASDEVALLAIQGPRAHDIVQAVTGVAAGDIKFYHFVQLEAGTFPGCDRVILSHTGYTGEPGFELYARPEDAPRLWHLLMEAGAPHGLQPAGLGARDTLRLEAGYCLYGNDLTEETNPLEAGLGWLVKFDKGPFVGREALLAVREQGPARRLIGFVVEERGLPRPGYPILDGTGEAVGIVTSGSQSPVLGRGIGLGYVPNDPAFTTPGTRLGVSARGRTLPAVVTRPPFHKK
ncbi:glycine cleavage system aminomethyltransferase GcvT [Rhodocaloribacter litoris]|uniref:glycine cleavage system aminomethyltransferase GcvT n=1 Tax=Rhodocaloribacter litoris TaxID=2558931 RepID=UPI00141ED66D|nr:glycine cleavage system aminomethyltransferase GcvT [Rhodocaloribacter litoris]QXD14702.1 glycine cleavage system aminomethyltransferase GcvT [Rhodocaloribacter litoris]